MSLEIRSVKDTGVPDKERVVLVAENECDAGNYLVMRTGLSDGQPTTLIQDTFWIPDRRVNKGDYVVLYSKSGTAKTKSNKDGSTTYFFYLHKDSAIWDKNDSCVVLLEAERWKSLSPDEF